MQVPLKVTFEAGLEPDPALETRIEHEARKLEQFAGHRPIRSIPARS
jgi:hypothetical protein